MSDEQKEVRTMLRIPEDLYEQIRVLAEKEFRSVNSQMIYILKEVLLNKRIRIYFTNEDDYEPV